VTYSDEERLRRQVAELRDAGLGNEAIGRLVQLESQVQSAAAALGDAGAEPMHQAGVRAGTGLAAGLKAQVASLNASMTRLAEATVRRLRDDMGAA
jgi:DNA-binding transcriptional MerR regulator